MSNHDAPDGDPPASLDDPDWVDRIVAKAMESAEKAAEDPTVAAPAPAPDRSAAAPAPRPRPRPRPESSATASQPKPRRPRPAEPGAAVAGQRARTPVGVTAGAVGADDSAQGATSVFDDEAAVVEAPLPIEPDETEEKHGSRNRALLEWIAVIAGAIAVAFLVKTFLIQAFYIPSASMEPTLQINDRVLVNKLSYDFGDVKRGDLVVFERPDNLVSETDDLIKRVVGLPGETVELIDGRVFITGRALSEPYVGDQPTNWLGFDETARELCGGDDICTVPEGHVFVMGDNRTGSTDSRRFGPIEDDAIVGRAFLRIWPLNDIGWL